MCGIIGAVAASPRDWSTFARQLHSLQHRGPDGSGQWIRERVALGHTRLSIIDGSVAAGQPMTLDGAGTIVFNGEIFDHELHRRELEAAGEVFVTRSDTEVLLRGLRRCGERFLRRLHGMFAFAWLPPTGDELWVGRDHAGIKPLYVANGAFGFAFASESRALAGLLGDLGARPPLSLDAFRAVLCWGCIPEPMTAFRGIEMLPADTVMKVPVLRPGRPETNRTGRITYGVEQSGSLEGIVDSVRAAVRRHIVSDHPVALFLSAGIDSSVLAAELARLGDRKVHAITVSLGSHGADDEVSLARDLAARLGIPLQVVEAGDWLERLDRAWDAFDGPSIDGFNTFVIAQVSRELGFKVALSGLGADEVFGGYRHLRRRVPGLERLGGFFIPRTLAQRAAQSTRPGVRRTGIVAESVGRGQPMQLAARRLLSDAEVQSLLPGGCDRGVEDEDPLLLEQRTYLRDLLLRDTDVMGMASGVEIRAPYLDPDVLQAAVNFGTSRLLDPRRPRKWVLREPWSSALGSSHLRRPKSGFTLDVPAWLSTRGQQRLKRARDVLTGILEPSGFERTWDRCIRGLQGRHPSAWTPLVAFIQLATQVDRWGSPV